MTKNHLNLVKKIIPISSCHVCRPDKWEQGKPSIGIYRCNKCKEVVRVTLTQTKGE